VRGEVRVPILGDGDIIAARQQGRELAQLSGLTGTDVTLVATAISEVARNIVSYAGEGEVVLRIEHTGQRSLVVTACDNGPGIANVELAMQDGYSTGHSLGLGLPGARRLMDEFEIVSSVGCGTSVTMKKWLR
jgi:serine/threonine-protein kinase RsbT